MGKLIIFGIGLVLASACMLFAPAAFVANIPDAPAQQIPVSTNAEFPIAAVVIGVVCIVALVVVVKMIQAGHGITLFVILLVVGAAWFFLASDKTGDGLGDNQIIAVVQPRGDNPSWDSQYSTVNKENATANVITAASFTVYIIAALLLAVGLSFLFILKGSRG